MPAEQEALEKQRRPVVEGHVGRDSRHLGAEVLDRIHQMR
jgi:hypothetical protein